MNRLIVSAAHWRKQINRNLGQHKWSIYCSPSNPLIVQNWYHHICTQTEMFIHVDIRRIALWIAQFFYDAYLSIHLKCYSKFWWQHRFVNIEPSKGALMYISAHNILKSNIAKELLLQTSEYDDDTYYRLHIFQCD